MANTSMIQVVTPTYNRAHTLINCYHSLLQQTNPSFTWLIIDDGSTDPTEQLVKQWIADNRIPIRYVHKENGGKASALNLAMDLTDETYFVCLDSDDTFSTDAIERALLQLASIQDDSRYSGILALRTNLQGKVIGGKQIPALVTDITLSELLGIYKIRSEVICFYKSAVLMQYRFPVISGERFISPSYLENEICRKYRYIVSRDVTCYCQYQTDGLTMNKRHVIKQNPIGYTLVKKVHFELATGFIEKCRHGIMYNCGCILSNDRDWLKHSPRKMLTILLYPLGWLAYLVRFKSRSQYE